MRVLLVIPECDPWSTSVYLIGYRFFKTLQGLVDVTLVTRERNRAGLIEAGETRAIEYIPDHPAILRYHNWVARLTMRGNVNWPLLRILGYPDYAAFDRQVFEQYKGPVACGEYDVVHVFTPIVPRYPVSLVAACQATPLVLGPVNGGLPYPPGFQDIAHQEFDYLNALRVFSRWLPGYKRTYTRARRVLVGSTYTLRWLQRVFPRHAHQFELFFENGVPADFFGPPRTTRTGECINLLFVGRLVPFKCVDVVLMALARLPEALRHRVQLTIVGDGAQRSALENLAQQLGIAAQVRFTGQVAQAETAMYYRQADIFCFPSIREFGGAVVLEALAAGLPCIVADYGGPGEYVTDATGFRLQPRSREAMAQQMAQKIQLLMDDDALYRGMSAQAVERARQFEWARKGQDLLAIYQRVCDKV